MDKSQVIGMLRAEERKLRRELKQVQAALAAFSEEGHTPKSYEAKIKKTCRKCGKAYQAKKSTSLFCGQSCRLSWWQEERARQKEAATDKKLKPKTLLPGDQLRASKA